MTLTNPALAAASRRRDSAFDDRIRITRVRARTPRTIAPC
jgi:hypothetical protein